MNTRIAITRGSVEEKMKQLEKEWAQYEPLLKRYNKATALLQAATEAGDTAKIGRFTKGLNQVVEQINNL